LKAVELRRFIETHDTEDESDGEESVFNTLTSQAGLELVNRLHVAVEDPINNHEVLQHDHSDLADTTGNAKVLQMYDDMGQEEYVLIILIT